MISQLPCVVKPWLLEFSEFLENIIGHEHKGLMPSSWEVQGKEKSENNKNIPIKSGDWFAYVVDE
jgi:hypothetical protein